MWAAALKPRPSWTAIHLRKPGCSTTSRLPACARASGIPRRRREPDLRVEGRGQRGLQRRKAEGGWTIKGFFVAADQYFFEDFQSGQRFRGSVQTLDETSFRLFAHMTGDAHPLHYDTEYARSTRFGAPIAHGLLLMAMTALGAGPLSVHVEATMVAFLEQGACFLKPVLMGDTVTPELEVAETRLTP